MSQIQFNPDSLMTSGKRLEAAVEEMVSATQSLLAEVSDPSVLGTNDTLGGIASGLYQVAVQAVQESVASVQETYGAHGGKLHAAAEQYRAVEEGFAQAGTTLQGSVNI